MIESYLKSPDYLSLAVKTRADYRYYLDMLKKEYGKFSWATLNRKTVIKIRDKFADTPRKANYVLAILSILGRHAIDLEIRSDNPAKDVRKLRIDSDGYKPWSEDQREIFEDQIQNQTIRLAYFLALYTGQRQADVLQMRWNDIQDGWLNLKQQKTGEELTIPIPPKLQTILDETKKSGLTIIATKQGRAYTSHGFNTLWYRALDGIGLAGVVQFHGLRKNATIELLEAGCSEKEVMAITGHKTSSMVSHYSKQIEQKKLARSAAKKRSEND